MAWTITPAQQAVLLGSHEMVTTVSVVRGSEFIADIEIIDGSVGATYSTQGGRDGSIIVDRNLIDTGVLNPLTDEVYIRTGIRDYLEIPIFTGRVDVHNAASNGEVEVLLLSRGAEAIRAAFETPWAAEDSNQARLEIARILQDVNPDWAVDVSNARESTIGRGLVWEDDRGQALDQLATGSSLIWQPDRVGGFTVFDNPYSIGPSLGSESVVLLRDGENGTVVDVQDAKSREGIYNSVTVVAERFGNQVPIRVTVRDSDPVSPTLWGGLFGKQNLVIKSQLPIDTNGATDLAIRILRQSLALQRSWTVTCPHMPLLDPGDVFGLWYLGTVYTLVAEGIDYSVTAEQPTVITGRELALHELEVLSL